MDQTIDLNQILKIGAIVYSLFNFLIGFLLYRELMRINSVLKIRGKNFFIIVFNLYIAALLGILIFAILS